MNEEYTLCKDIRAKTQETLGVFPVDLACGIQSKDLGPNAAEIIASCKQAFPPGVVLDLCAIQYPKYAYDFQRYSEIRTKIVSQKFLDTLANFAFQTLSKKLVHLHTAKYFHGDIKRDNCAFMKPVEEGILNADSIRFADFGNAFQCDSLENIQRAVDYVFKNFAQFQDIAPEPVKKPIQWKLLRDLGQRPLRKDKYSFLQIIDYLCLIGSVAGLFGTLQQQQLFIDNKITKINSVIDEKLSI